MTGSPSSSRSMTGSNTSPLATCHSIVSKLLSTMSRLSLRSPRSLLQGHGRRGSMTCRRRDPPAARCWLCHVSCRLIPLPSPGMHVWQLERPAYYARAVRHEIGVHLRPKTQPRPLSQCSTVQWFCIAQPSERFAYQPSIGARADNREGQLLPNTAQGTVSFRD